MDQWWDEWQLRILVLASLGAQYLLVYFVVVRKSYISPRLRVLLRLAHIGSDALALFTLATLFNRQKAGPSCSYARGDRDLELLWAPLVLMHLGGQVVITSYKIEDNEQWSRRILTSLSKVTVALYVFYKSWSSDNKRLLVSTILLFIVMILRGFQKVLDLKSSSFNALRKASSSEVNTNVIQEVVYPGRLPTTHLPILPYQLFLDIPCPSDDRVRIMKKFWALNLSSAYQAIESALSGMTIFLYTKDDRRSFFDFKNAPPALILRRCTRGLAYIMLATALLLVLLLPRKAYANNRADALTTLVLLYGTFMLETVYSMVSHFFLDKFSGRILQHNLIGLSAHNSRWHSRLRRLQCKDLVNEYFGHMEPRDSCKEITELVRLHVESGWRTCISLRSVDMDLKVVWQGLKEIKSHTSQISPKSPPIPLGQGVTEQSLSDRDYYRRFNETRGDWTLAKYGCSPELGWSTRRPFDESVIVWHLATDLCFHHPAVAVSLGDLEHSRAFHCKVMSNYMMHLLSENPEMLLPGSRKRLFTMAYNELEGIIGREEVPRDEREFTQRVIEKYSAASTPDSFVGHAFGLAKSLLEFGDATRMWKVIQGVWVEMLCFSAGRCRGYLHAEALGTGVEYLSYVWVLLAYSGMETFPEKLQSRENQSFGSHEFPVDDGSEDPAATTTFASESEGSGHVVLQV